MQKKVIKKQFEKAPKRKDDEKTRMTQMIGLIRAILTYLFQFQLSITPIWELLAM